MKLELPLEIKKIEKDIFIKYLDFKISKTKKYYLRNEILNLFTEFCVLENIKPEVYEDLYVYKFLNKVQEFIIYKNYFILVYRYRVARSSIYKLSLKKIKFEIISIKEYLNIRDFVISGFHARDNLINIDFLPFYDYSPEIKHSSEIGNGISFLNKVLSNNIFQNPAKWNKLLYNFLSIHSIQSKQLLINDKKIESVDKLLEMLDYMIDYIDEIIKKKKNNSYIFAELKNLGFQPGWGNTPERIRETMKMLLELFNSPDSNRLENFISRIPMISKIAVMSPHGWFGQKNVLGRPDTGGQIVYILDQVRYLEKKLKESLSFAGIEVEPKIIIITRFIPINDGTTSNVKREKVFNTDNCWIVRVPFKKKNGSILKHWISRFNLWPYMEQFARDTNKMLLKEFNSSPDLIIGNYSDGNLAASFLSRALNVTQCNIAHALEKTKYLFSDLYWKDLENDYHFSFQFTADLISMNMADFIITSSFQEIAGTQNSRGQYESFQFYSMPDLYHVKSGINLFYPKFNVIPPGAPEELYFPYYNKELRDSELTDRIYNRLFNDNDNFIIGNLEDKNKFPIYSAARLDKIKNLTGLAECFGKSSELQKIANLIIVGGKPDPALVKADEEKAQIYQMYEIIKKYNLQNNFRWIAKSFNRDENAEAYKIIAEKTGIFVQPAFFEAFGLTVIEAMASGLPIFATQFGGPSEIINNGINGFLINPTLQEEMAQIILNFFKNSMENHKFWKSISEAGMKRVQEAFNWNLSSEKLLKLACLHGFWKFAVSTKAKEKMMLYCDIIYDNFIRKRLPDNY